MSAGRGLRLPKEKGANVQLLNFNLRMHENSLFAVLLRSPWWISFAIAAGLFALVRMFIPDIYAAFVPLPFVVIGGIAAWKQLQLPSAKRVAQTVEAVRTMSWPQFSIAIEEAFRRDGYSVSKLSGDGADFLAIKTGRIAVIACKRWKAAHVGVEPLRALDAARDEHSAHDCVYVAAGEVSENARKFAKEKRIRLVHDVALAQLLPRVGRSKA